MKFSKKYFLKIPLYGLTYKEEMPLKHYYFDNLYTKIKVLITINCQVLEIYLLKVRFSGSNQ